MINVVLVRNPFKPDQHESQYRPYKANMPLSFYAKQDGDWVYSINGQEATLDTIVNDGDYIVAMPQIDGKFFGIILTIGLSIATGGIASGAIFGIQSIIWRTVLSMAIGMIGNMLVNKLTQPKADRSHTDSAQANTYGWGGAKTVTGQGYPLAVTYGRMKSAGLLLSRHIISDGEKQYLNLLYCAGEGELSKIEDIRINANPVSNYQDVQVDIRLGTNDQTVIPNFNDNYADQVLNYELKTGWSTQRVQGDACNAIELTISFPNGLYYSNDTGGMDATSVTLDAEIRKAGEDEEWHKLPLSNQKGMQAFVKKSGDGWSFTRQKSDAEIAEGDYKGKVTEATNTAFYRVYRFDNLDKAQYEVRVRCSSKDGSSIRYNNKVYWNQLTQIIYDDFVHPGKALIGIKALATSQLNGSDPEVSWIQERSAVYVFNPYQQKYEVQRADNPAWAAYDLLHMARKFGDEYVVFGQPHGRMDYDAFKAWANNCDKNGFTFNYIYDSASRLWDALKYPENVGRGKVIPQGTRFTCVSDYKSTPVQLFTVANIKQGSFSEEFQGIQSRANSVEISFLNKDKDYERDVIPVYGDTYDESDTLTNPAQIELMGCTSLDQAFKHGKHYLRCNKYEVRTVSIEAFTDAMACTIGDIILIQHDVPEWGEGGRVVTVTGNTITLDKEVSTLPGRQYQLLIRNNATDAVTTFTVLSVIARNVTVKESITVEPGSVYAFGELTKAAKPFRVLAITEGGTDLTRKIQCMEYYPEVYTNDDGSVPVIDYKSEVGSDIEDIGLVSDVYGANGIMYSRIAVRWQLPRDGKITNVVVNYRNAKSDTWKYVGNFPASPNSTEISDVLLGATYEVRVQAINDLGQLTTGVTKEIVIPKMQAPGDVQNLHVVSRYNLTADKSVYYDLQVMFEPPANPGNFDSAEVWYKLKSKNGQAITGQDWQYAGSSNSQVIIKALGPGEEYEVKAVAVDRFGNRSDTAQVVDVVVKAMDEVPDMPKNFTVSFKDYATASWNDVLNADVDYYELRADNDPGKDTNALLAKVKGTSANLPLTKRSGTVYLYARSTLGKYSTPATYSYNLPQLEAPTFEVKDQLGGFSLYFGAKPPQAYVIRCHVIGDDRTDDLETTSSMLTYSNKAGVYRVRCEYVDVFGSSLVAEKSVTIKDRVDKSLLDAEALGLKAMDESIQAMSSEVGTMKTSVNGFESKLVQLENGITQKVTDLNRNLSGQITTLSNGIDLRVTQAIGSMSGKDIVSRINLSPEGTRIDGKLLHVTGQALFDNNIITEGMLQANSVTADKMQVDSLSTITGTIGTLRTKTSGARVEISDDLITCFDENNNVRIKLGCW